MLSKDAFVELALSFPGTEMNPHFDRVGFKIIGKRMFASYLEKDHTANVFLSVEEQRQFCELDPAHIFPVPNKWGEKGATTLVLNGLERAVVEEALRSAYLHNSWKKNG